MNFPKIAEQVIEKLGGKNNIATAAHCATRLRIVLNDESKVDKEGIEAIEGVKANSLWRVSTKLFLAQVRSIKFMNNLLNNVVLVM